MQIRTDTVPKQGLIIDTQEPFDRFQSLLEMDRKNECRFLSPVLIRARIRNLPPYIEVTGTLDAKLRLSCSRCLGRYAHGLSTSFSVTYCRAGHAPTPEISESEVEWTGEDSDLYYFKGDIIDLTEAVQEQLVMALPVKPLCQADCKGLCNGCGADLNTEKCKCKNNPVDPRFAVLKNLKID